MARSSHPRRFSVKKVFLEISQNSQENTCARVSFLIKLQVPGLKVEFCEISKNTFSYRTPMAHTIHVASVNHVFSLRSLSKRRFAVSFFFGNLFHGLFVLQIKLLLAKASSCNNYCVLRFICISMRVF